VALALLGARIATACGSPGQVPQDASSRRAASRRPTIVMVLVDDNRDSSLADSV
jgi:hypothetical protein